jgi:hypothetical protein
MNQLSGLLSQLQPKPNIGTKILFAQANHSTKENESRLSFLSLFEYLYTFPNDSKACVLSLSHLYFPRICGSHVFLPAPLLPLLLYYYQTIFLIF